MNPEWGDFKVLIALSRGGSVAGAARELGVEGSTVSRRLAALEDSLGACLIARGGREFAWTAEGHAALSAAETMSAAVAAATRSCRESKQDVAGVVRVSLTPGLVPILLTRLLPELHKKQLTLKLDLRGDYKRVDLINGEADVAVRFARPSETGLVGRHALDAGWCVYSSIAYAGTRGMPGSIAELATHQLVLYVEAMHGIAPLRWLEAHRGKDFIRFDNLEIVAQLIASGGGIGILPAFFEATTPGLLRVFPMPVTSNTGWVVYHEASREKARVRAAVDALVAFFSAEKPLFSGIPG